MKHLLLVSFILFVVSCGEAEKKVCAPMPVSYAGPNKIILQNSGYPQYAGIGMAARKGTSYQWSPVHDLQKPKASFTYAWPKKSETYTLTASNACGSVQSQVFVQVSSIGK